MTIENIPFRNGPDWAILTRHCRIECFKPYYTPKYGVKNVLKKVGNKEWFDYGGDSNEWEGFNGFDFCNKIEADCVEIEVDGAATVMPGDFQNCKKLVISTVVSDSTYGRDDNGRESYEHELEVIDKINHKNVHLRLNDTISIIDHPGLHDGAKVWKMDDVLKFLDRLVSLL